MKNKISLIVLAILLVFTTGAGLVMANSENGWLDWTGTDELDNGSKLITQLVSDVNELNAELVSIQLDIDTWITNEEVTIEEMDLYPTDGIVTYEEKLAALEVIHGNNAGGLADLTQDLADINASLNDLITVEAIDTSVDPTPLDSVITPEDKVTLINNYIDSLQSQLGDMTAERNWLYDELLLAISESEQFEVDVCLAIDDLPEGIRNREVYTNICPLP